MPVVSVPQAPKATINITGVEVQVSSDFRVSGDESSVFVPGSDAKGTSLDVPAPGQPIQTVKLHLLTPSGTAGNVQYVLSNVTTYPGIAGNYPLDSLANPDTSPDMKFAAGSDAARQRSGIITFDPSGDTVTPLQIYDYAAYGHLTATLTFRKGNKSVRFVIEKDLPEMPDNGNKMAASGWKALEDYGTGTYTSITNNNLEPARDIDDNPQLPGNGSVGDGLTTLEEYRGFVVRGRHRRLNPFHKDLFLHVDRDLQGYLASTQNLPLTLHLIDNGEAQETQSSDAMYAGLYPIINSFNGTLPGVRPHRGLRVRRQTEDVNVFIQATKTLVPVWTIYLGYSFLDTMDPAQPPDPKAPLSSGIPCCSPDANQVIDIYPRTLLNDGISIGPNGLIDSSRDQNGNPVIPCSSATTTTNCDWFITSPSTLYGVTDVILPGDDGILHTVPTPGSDDYYTRLMHGCGINTVYTLLPDGDLDTVEDSNVGHEVGHGVAMEHTTTCGDIMYVDVSKVDAVESHVLPIAMDYSEADKARITLHQ